MKKIRKITLAVIAGIAFCSIVAGVLDIRNLKEREKRARAECRKIHEPYGIYEKYFKRALDFFLGSVALIVLCPLMLVTALLVKMKLGSPVLFVQERPGRDEKIFKLKKFRSMADRRDAAGKLFPDELRLTAFGKILRSTSMDELPEFFNVLKGDMSIVGPRPLMTKYLSYYTEEEHHRHDIRPGLTGLAQVNGRSFLTWEKIFELDVEYTKQITFFGDFKIIRQTIRKVIEKRNVADATGSYTDEQGKLHMISKGKDVIVHRPLDIERM